MNKEILITFNTGQFDDDDHERSNGEIIFYKDNTYRYDAWEEGDYSKWKVLKGKLHVKHANELFYTICNQGSDKQLSEALVAHLIMEKILS